MQNTKYSWNNTDKQLYGHTLASRAGWYNKSVWVKLRNYFIESNPLCAMCLDKGKVKGADIVHHKISLTGISDKDWELFLDYDNLESCCISCHSRHTRRSHSKYSDKNLNRGKELMDLMSS